MNSTEYRQVVGAFATGVTVITTRAGDRLHGMTASAVASVSLDPLLLLVCVDRTANCHDQLEQAGLFAVNILAEDQQELSDFFAQRQQPVHDSWPGVRHRLSADGAPLLEGCLGHLVCQVAERYPGGDHTIFVGQVLTGSLEREAEPLVYFRSRYRRLAGS